MLYIGLQHRSFFDCALGKKYYEVKIDDDTFLTAHQMKQLQKRNDQLEENLILKKRLPYSRLARRTIKGQDLPEDHPFQEIEAFYVAQCIYNTTMMFSPDILLGCGVMKQIHLQKKIHREFTKIMNNYVNLPKYFSKIKGSSWCYRLFKVGKKITSF